MSLLTPRTDFVEARTSAFQSIHNLRINGNFDFWQRGTSFTSVTNGLYTADRWRYQKLGTASLQNITQDTDVPTVTQSGFQSLYSMLITQSATTDVTVDAGDLLGIGQRMEGQDYVNLHGGKGREQFWIKASIAGVYPIAFRNSAANRSYVTTFTVAAANTWQKITIDIALDSSGTWLFDNGIGLVMNIGLMVGSTYQTATQGSWVAGEFYAPSGVTLVNVAGTSGATIRLAQSSCIPGDFVATSGVVADLPFRRAGRTIGDELRMCWRYLYRVVNDIGFNQTLGTVIVRDSTTVTLITTYPVQLRTSASVTGAPASSFIVQGGNPIGNRIPSAFALLDGGIYSSRIDFTLPSGGLYGGSSLFIFNNTIGTAFINFDAEL